VVAFIVKVRLVEAIEKSSVGNDIVVSFRAKYINKDNSCRMLRSAWPKKPIHDEEACVTTVSLAAAIIEGTAAEALARPCEKPSPIDRATFASIIQQQNGIAQKGKL